MPKITVVCEGHTEQAFCQRLLVPHFSKYSIQLYAPLIRKSMGGIVKWEVLKKQLLLHLKTDTRGYVTTLIDYYGLQACHVFPRWDEAEAEPEPVQRMEILEDGMFHDIPEFFRNRFLPYIQLHEFEGLLFSDIHAFYHLFPGRDLVGREELEHIFQHYKNPELINGEKRTSPSNRLKRIVYGYNKVVDGVLLAETIGLAGIRRKNLRFDRWVRELEEMAR